MTDGKHTPPDTRIVHKREDGTWLELVALWDNAKVLATGKLTIPEGFRPGDVINVIAVKVHPRNEPANGNGASRPVERSAPAGRKVARAPK